jgi:predicted nucleic acid-binding protein
MPIFLDTNVLIYAYSDDEPDKQAIARALCSLPDRWISTQVMIEFSNIARRKMGMDWETITLALLELRKNFKVLTTTDATIIMASRLADRYQLSWFDSLIVSASLEAKANTLYSEDLNNSQVYENQITVINPFK